jgi:serine/threonine-protein kinase RsbW
VQCLFLTGDVVISGPTDQEKRYKDTWRNWSEPNMVGTTQAMPRADQTARRGGQVETLCSRAEIPAAIEAVVRAMADQLYAERDIFAVRLALEEALVNAIRHGNQEDLSRHVNVSYLVGPERVLIEVQDEGEGFDPRAVPDPLAPENLERSSGRGLHLMRTYMTWVRYNGRGNCVTMCKSRNGTDRM